MLFRNADFPDQYVNMQHPDDYKVVSEPFVEYINHSSGYKHRLIVRVCWQKSSTEFMPMSFVLDSGAPGHLYLSSKAQSMLEGMGRIHQDTEAFTAFVDILGAGQFPVQPSPPGYAPASIIGLGVIMKLGLRVRDGGFAFEDAPVAW